MIEVFDYLWSIIEFTALVINSVVCTVNICLTCSAYIGKLIVNVVSKLSNNVYNVVSSIGSGITVMYEDFPYFLTDIQNIIFFVDSVFTFFYESIISGISSVYNTWINTIYLIFYTTVSIKDSICGMYRTGLRTVYDCIVTVKGALILIGNIIWMCLTLIPGVFVYSFSMCLFFINKCTEEVMGILKTTTDMLLDFFADICIFVIDTPFEAVCGLVVGFGLVYFTNKHRNMIFALASQQLQKILKYMKENFSKAFIIVVCFLFFSFNKFKNLLSSVKQTIIENYCRVLNIQNNIESPNFNERLCVVCKDSEINVVIIPCKHMCLCERCSQNAVFRTYRGAMCPVCRCEINEILKVYL